MNWMAAKLQQNLWIFVIPVLLLATGLAAQRLSGFPFAVNESATKFLAGGIGDGPYSFTEVIEATKSYFPDQAYGMPMLSSVWGQIFGWNEFSLRLLPFYAGVLGLAWVHRTGRDWFGPFAGLVALMLLASSVFFITYMHVFRAFSFVVMFVSMVTWSYCRIALSSYSLNSRRGTQQIFVLGSVGILYSHYFGALYLAGLSLMHLVLLPKNRQWWRPVWLWGIAAILFLPQLSGYLAGVGFIQTQSWFTSADMKAPEVISWFVNVLTNGLVYVSESFSLWILLSIILVALVGWYLRRREPISRIMFLLFTTLTVLGLMLTVNEIFLVMLPHRLRYFISMWPLIALLAGWMVWRSRERWRYVAVSLVSVWFIYGFWANTVSRFRFDIDESLNRLPLNYAARELETYAGQADLLALGHSGSMHWRSHLPEDQQSLDELRVDSTYALSEHLRVWILLTRAEIAGYDDLVEQLPDDLIRCHRYVFRKEFLLVLFVWSPVHCPSDEPAEMRFGDEIKLAASEVELISEDTLQVDLLMHSDEITGMTAYSTAIHVFAVESGEKVAQGDQGAVARSLQPCSQ